MAVDTLTKPVKLFKRIKTGKITISKNGLKRKNLKRSFIGRLESF
jgi:hypothetical protein